jgi:hypothetical protein
VIRFVVAIVASFLLGSLASVLRHITVGGLSLLTWFGIGALLGIVGSALFLRGLYREFMGPAAAIDAHFQGAL